MSEIEWTNKTWNPLRGCSVFSAGCKRCYAMKMAHRFSGPGGPYEGLTTLSKGGPVWADKVRLVPELLDAPLRWHKPSLVFVNSMSDLFHEAVPEPFIKDVFEVMRRAHWHRFQVLTKRADRLAELAPSLHWPPNVWMGVSVESESYLGRVESLRTVPAAVRFLSIEPLIGPVPLLNLDGIDWVIVGGESGPGARPMALDWAREVRDKCIEAGVAFFLKQLGGERDKRGGASAVLDGQHWTEYPE